MKKSGKMLKIIGFSSLGFFLIIISTIILLHEIFITPAFVKKEVTRIFKKSFNKDIDLEIKKISLFTGIEINRLAVYNPAYSSKKVFFKIDGFKIKYNLFYLLLFKVKVNEITLNNPYLFLEYNNKLGKWNYSDYLATTEKKKEKKQGGSLFNMNLELKMLSINNLTVEFIKDSYLKLTGINYTANFKLNEPSLKGINTASFNFFNTGNKNISFYNKNTKIIMPLNLNIELNANNKKAGKLRFTYNLKDQLIEFNKKFFTLPDINIVFDSKVVLEDSRFIINEFIIEVNKNPVIDIKGKILKFNTKPEIQMTLQKNSINLKEFEKYINTFIERKDFKISGFFNTSQVFFKKNPYSKIPFLLGEIQLKEIGFILPEKNISISNLNFSADFKLNEQKYLTGNINMNITAFLADLMRIKNFNLTSSIIITADNKKKSSDLDKIKLLSLSINDCTINKADLNAVVHLENNKLEGEINLSGLNLNEFNKYTLGNLNLNNKIESIGLENFNNSLNLDITNFILISKVSNRNYYSSKLPVFIATSQKFDTIKRNLSIQFFNAKISDFCTILLKGGYKNKTFTGSIDEFKIITQNIKDKLPENIIYALPFRSFNGIINTTGKINFQDNKLTADIITTNNRLLLENQDSGLKINKLYSRLTVTNIGKEGTFNYNFFLNDIQNKIITYNSNLKDYQIKYEEFLDHIDLVSSIAAMGNKINIHKLNLAIPNINFNFNLSGNLIISPLGNIDLITDLKFEPDKEIHFLNSGKFNGTLDLFASVNSGFIKNGHLVNGKILFNNFSFFMKDIIIDRVNGYLPFRHIITKNNLDKKFLLTKSVKDDLQLLNYPLNRAYINTPDNFTINKIKINDIELDKASFDMEYNDNYLSLKSGYMELLNGSIFINNSFFDLGNMSPETYRYKLNMEISGIDIRKLKFIKDVKKNEDTKIFANIRVNGNGKINKSGIDLEKSGDIYGAFNVTHIGNEVASKLLSVLDPKEKDGNISYVKELLYSGAWCELFTLEVKYGQIIPKIWMNKAAYMVWLPLPPSPIEFKNKSLDVILQSFKKSEKE